MSRENGGALLHAPVAEFAGGSICVDKTIDPPRVNALKGRREQLTDLTATRGREGYSLRVLRSQDSPRVSVSKEIAGNPNLSIVIASHSHPALAPG